MTKEEDNWFVVVAKVRNISEKESIEPIAQAFVDKVVELSKRFAIAHQVAIDMEVIFNPDKDENEGLSIEEEFASINKIADIVDEEHPNLLKEEEE